MNTQNTRRTTTYNRCIDARINARENKKTVIRTDGRRSRRQSGFINSKLFKISFMAFLVLFICVAGILNITAEGSEKPVERQYKSIQVEEGDTLWSIALEYNDETLSHASTDEYIDDIKSINNLVRDDKITAGNYIIVPIYIVEN